MLRSSYTDDLIEAGCDEAGRGCLAGPVFAAAVILPKNIHLEKLNDSKKISEANRYLLRKTIEEKALAWAVEMVSPEEIDTINILNASFLAMEKAIGKLKIQPDLLLIDGNRFRTKLHLPYHCIIKGDGIFQSIAAASILAKTYRDDFMIRAHQLHPEYQWQRNKGYPTREHKLAISQFGLTPLHRKTFNYQLRLDI